MKFLLTNDDGVYAPGLRAMRPALARMGDVMVVAPASEQSAVGHSITLLAPLVVNRKGVYTDLAKWALGKGYWHLRVDGKLLPTRPFPRIDRFKEHGHTGHDINPDSRTHAGGEL